MQVQYKGESLPTGIELRVDLIKGSDRIERFPNVVISKSDMTNPAQVREYDISGVTASSPGAYTIRVRFEGEGSNAFIDSNPDNNEAVGTLAITPAPLVPFGFWFCGSCKLWHV